jgi:hypothetical protein
LEWLFIAKAPEEIRMKVPKKTKGEDVGSGKKGNK